MSTDGTSQLGELPMEVFEKFIGALEGAEIPKEVRDRLHTTLLIDQKFTDGALRSAVFGEDDGE